MDRMLNMILRRIIGRLVGRGVDAVIDKTSGGDKRAKASARKMKQAARIARRSSRM